MKKWVVVSVIVLLFATTVSAAGRFSGSYVVNGTNPGAAAYRGYLTITPRGGVYDVQWTIGKLVYVGVGVVVNDTLAAHGNRFTRRARRRGAETAEKRDS